MLVVKGKEWLSRINYQIATCLYDGYGFMMSASTWCPTRILLNNFYVYLYGGFVQKEFGYTCEYMCVCVVYAMMCACLSDFFSNREYCCTPWRWPTPKTKHSTPRDVRHRLWHTVRQELYAKVSDTPYAVTPYTVRHTPLCSQIVHCAYAKK